MGNRNIDIPLLFKYSFELFKHYASFVIGVMTTYFILGMVPQVYLYFFTPKDPTLENQIVSTIAMLVQLFLALGFTKIMLYLIEDRPVEVNDLINNGSIFLDYFIAYFLYFIVVGIGLFILILPGIYLAFRLQFYPYYILKHNDSSFNALKKSWYVTEKGQLNIFLFSVCVVLLNVLGALVIGIGIIVTYPISTMATAIVFEGLDQDAEHIPTAEYQL